MTPVTESNNNGFTLMEIMVSLLVLTIVIMAVFRLQSSTLSLEVIAEFDHTAPFLAEQILARLQVEADWDDRTDAGDFGDTPRGYRYEFTIAPSVAEDLPATEERLKRIDILITADGGHLEYRLPAYRLAPP